MKILFAQRCRDAEISVIVTGNATYAGNCDAACGADANLSAPLRLCANPKTVSA
jgi:hypothetical protein